MRILKVTKVIKVAVLTSLLLMVDQVNSAVWTITYPQTSNDANKHNEYPLAVLKLALDTTGVNYTLVPAEREMLQAKAIRQLKENRDINILWGMTDKQREEELRPIHIPIAKGLAGWRVALVRSKDEARFSQITTLKELINFTAIQGKDWPDTSVLQSNGFNVVTAADYKGSLHELRLGVGDFFPHSIVDINSDLQELDYGSDIILEQKFILQYPAASYFFVNKSNVTLANLIDTGLRRAIKSGALDNLFYATFNDTLNSLNLSQRQIYRLTNPRLSNDAPLNDASLWFEFQAPTTNQ